MQYRIISITPITTAQRLKELIKESGYTQEKFGEVFGLWGAANGSFKVEKAFPAKTISKWVNGECSIRKKNLEALAKFFDVDVAYLECKQIEKKKDSTYKGQWDKFDEDFPNMAQELQLYESWIDYLTAIGCKIKPFPNDTVTNSSEHSFVEDGQIKTVAISISTANAYEYHITFPDGTIADYTEDEWKQLQQEIADYTIFKLEQMKGK